MDILDKIITENINRLIKESEANSDTDDAKVKSDWDVKNQPKKIDKHRRDGGHIVSDNERTRIKKFMDDNFIKVADVAYEIYPDHTDQGAQSQLEKQINGDRPLRYKQYHQIRKIIDMD